MPGPESTATKSTAPKKSRSFNLFGRRKKKEEKAPAAQQQEQNVSPPSAGRKRSNALTPAQARETQEMLQRQRELEKEKAERAQKVREKRNWFEDQMRQREQEKAEEQKAEAKSKWDLMVKLTRFQDQVKFHRLLDETRSDLDKVKSDSDKIKGTTHTSAVQIQMESLGEILTHAEGNIEKLRGAHEIVRSWSDSNFDEEIAELDAQKKSAEEAKAAAEGRIARSTEARARFEKHAKSKKVMKLIRKIASLNSGGAGNDVFEMLPQDAQAAANQGANQGANPGANPNQQQAPSTKEKAKAFFSRLWEFFTNFKEDLQGAADNINGIVADCFDFADLKAGSIGTGTIGAANSFFGAILNVIGGWKAFSKMYGEDAGRRTRNAQKSADDQESLDGQTIWRRVREGLGSVVNTLISIAGIGDGVVSAIGLDPVSNIIGIVTNSANLVLQCVNIADTAVRSRGVEHRKEKIRQKMLYKQQKYEKDTELSEAVGYFTLPVKARSKAVEEKRKALRIKLAQDDAALKLHGKGYEGQAIAKKESMAGAKFKDTTEYYKESYTTLSQKILAEKAWKREKDKPENNSKMTDEERKAYKKRILLMEALDLLNQYYLEDQERDRQRKSRRAGIAESVKAGVSVGANIMKLTGHLTAAFSGGTSEALTLAGGIVDVANNLGGLVQSGVQKLHAWSSGRNGHNNDKALRRNELALTLFESVADLTKGGSSGTNEYGWDAAAGTFNVDTVPDYRLKSASDRIGSFAGMIKGVDLDIEAAMGAGNRVSMLKLLSASFSQSQEVE